MPSVDLSPPTSLRKRALGAGAWNMVSLVGTQALRLGGNLIMARLLVPDMFGIMAISTTLSVVLHLLSDVGLRQNIIQSPRGDDPLFLNTAWTVQLLRGILLFAVTLLIAFGSWATQQINLWPAGSSYAAPELPLVLAVTGISAVIYGLQSNTIDLAVRAFQQKRVVILELTAQFVGLLVMLVFGYLTRSIWSLVAAGIVSTLVSTVMSHVLFEGPRSRLCWDKSALTELINYGRWILLSSMVGVLAMNGDRIWFGGVMSTFDMGVYSIAVLILSAVQVGLLKLGGAVVLPAFSEATRAGDKPRLLKLYNHFRLYFDTACLFACGLFLTVSPLIISWLYDDRYQDAGRILAILSWSFFTLRYSLAHQVWLAVGLTKYQAMDNIIRAVSLWVGMPVMLAIGGVDYAIWWVALHTFPTLILVFYVNRKLEIFSLKRELMVLPIIAVGALCGELVTRLFNGF